MKDKSNLNGSSILASYWRIVVLLPSESRLRYGSLRPQSGDRISHTWTNQEPMQAWVAWLDRYTLPNLCSATCAVVAVSSLIPDAPLRAPLMLAVGT